MDTLTLLATAFGLGLLFGAAPGPVFAATVQVGVRGGFRPALAVQLGSTVGDCVWAVLGLAGVGVLLQLDSLRFAIGVASVAYLLYFAGFMLSSVVWAFLFAALVDRVLGGAGARYARITYLACALAFLGLALVSLRDLWQPTRGLESGTAIPVAGHTLAASAMNTGPVAAMPGA